MTAPWESSAIGAAVDGVATATLPGAPPDETHLLVAVVQYFRNTTNDETNDWAGHETILDHQTALSRVRIHTMQGDGVTQSITCTWPAHVAARVDLMAFAGFTSATPITTWADSANQASADTTVVSPVTIPEAPAVGLAVVLLQNFVTNWTIEGDWTPRDGASADRAVIAATHLSEPGDTPQLAASWYPARQLYRFVAAWHASLPPEPEPPATRYYLGDQPLHRRLGDQPIG